MAFADGDAGVAFHPMAVNAVAIDAGAHRLHRVARPVEQVARIITTELTLQFVHLAAIADQRLPAVAAGRAPADPLRFQHHAPATCRQFQGCGQAGIAGAQHRNVGLHITLQRGQCGRFGRLAAYQLGGNAALTAGLAGAGREGGAGQVDRRSPR